MNYFSDGYSSPIFRKDSIYMLYFVDNSANSML